MFGNFCKGSPNIFLLVCTFLYLVCCYAACRHILVVRHITKFEKLFSVSKIPKQLTFTIYNWWCVLARVWRCNKYCDTHITIQYICWYSPRKYQRYFFYFHLTWKKLYLNTNTFTTKIKWFKKYVMIRTLRIIIVSRVSSLLSIRLLNQKFHSCALCSSGLVSLVFRCADVWQKFAFLNCSNTNFAHLYDLVLILG